MGERNRALDASLIHPNGPRAIDLCDGAIVDAPPHPYRRRLDSAAVTAARQAWDQAIAAVAAASRAYDHETDHGRRNGTVIDVSVGTT